MAKSPFSPKGGVVMRNYDVMFVVRPNLEDEATNTVVESMKNDYLKKNNLNKSAILLSQKENINNSNLKE